MLHSTFMSYVAYRYISRDGNIYPDPESFNPERFLSSGPKNPELDPQDFTFGYGRRCLPLF